jgi:DNA modification methylase
MVPGMARAASEIIHGDSLAVAERIAPGTVAAIYIDPPFATGDVQRGRGAAARYRDRADDPVAHAAWLRPWLVASHRALAATGSIFVHLDYRAVHYVKVTLDEVFGRERFVNELIWCYAVGGKSRRGFGRKHDTILWYGRSAEYAFFPDAVRVPRRAGSHMKVVRDATGAPVQQKVDRKTGKVYAYPVADGKVPEDWWSDIETLNHSDKQRTGWPSQKPERLVERCLRAVTHTARGRDHAADRHSSTSRPLQRR